MYSVGTSFVVRNHDHRQNLSLNLVEARIEGTKECPKVCGTFKLRPIGKVYFAFGVVVFLWVDIRV